MSNMDSSGFSSDSTYCSLFEMSDVNKRKKVQRSTAEILDEIKKMVNLHVQDKYLLGMHEVEKYMKLLSRIPFKTKKQNLLAENLKTVLYRIHKCVKMFQRSMSESMEFNKTNSGPLVCGLTQDFQMMKENQGELNTILLPIKNASEPASFCSDMLSNKMFINEPAKSQMIHHEPNNHSIAENNKFTVLIDEELNKNCEFAIGKNDLASMSSIDMFFTDEKMCLNDQQSSTLTNNSNSSFQNPDSNMMDINSETEVYFGSCSQELSGDSNLFKIPPPKSKKKYTKYFKGNVSSCSDSLPSKSSACNEDKMAISSNEVIINNSYQMKFPINESCSIEEDTKEKKLQKVKGDELTSLSSKILNMQESLFPKLELAVIPRPQNIPEEAFHGAKKLGSAFAKCYNDKIATLHCDVGTGVKSWEEIEEELDYINNLANKTTDALSLAFDSIHLQEKRASEREYREKVEKGNFHNFNERELEALEWDDFLSMNEVRLAELSAELRSKFLAEKNGQEKKDYYEDEDYSDLDWRNYKKD